MKFVALEEVIKIHDLMLEVGGGRSGIHDFSLLHSAIERPKVQYNGKYLYTSIWLMAGALLQSIGKNHPFEDANKRTAYYTTKLFLRMNGYILKSADKEVLRFMVGVDVDKTSTEDIADWLKKNSKKA